MNQQYLHSTHWEQYKTILWIKRSSSINYDTIFQMNSIDDVANE